MHVMNNAIILRREKQSNIIVISLTKNCYNRHQHLSFSKIEIKSLIKRKKCDIYVLQNCTLSKVFKREKNFSQNMQ
jgi:hypothetical protein